MCLPLIGAVITGISGAMSALTARAQSKAQADMDRRQAQIEGEAGAYEAERKSDQVKRVLGAGRAGMLANGIGLTGSAFDVLDESATEGALDVAAIRWNSRLRQDNNLFSARINDMNARSQGIAAPLAFLAPVIKGAAEYAQSFKKAA